jgi:hypothetical protein
LQTVGQNEKNKQKLHKLTQGELRPDREGGVQQKSHFFRVGPEKMAGMDLEWL